MPSTVTNWSATTTTCSFTISGMAHVALKIESNTPHSKINIISTDEENYHSHLHWEYCFKLLKKIVALDN